MEGHDSGTVIGMAWYRPEQWSLMRETAADPDVLEESYEEWLEVARRTILDLTRKGVRAERIVVDVDEFANWCAEQKRALDGSARAQYVTEKLRERYERSGDEAV